MKSVSVTAARNRLSALLREVRKGASIAITSRGIAVAHLVPPLSAWDIPPHVAELARRGLVVLPQNPTSTNWLYVSRPRVRGKSSAVAALLEERRSGR